MEVLGEVHRRSVWKAAAPTNRRYSGVGDTLLPATGAAEDCFLVRQAIADAPTVTGHYAKKFHLTLLTTQSSVLSSPVSSEEF
jgi:hypothetical protein